MLTEGLSVCIWQKVLEHDDENRDDDHNDNKEDEHDGNDYNNKQRRQ